MNLLQEATAPSAAPIDPDDLSSILSSSTGPQAFFDTESAPRPSFSSLATELKLNRVEGMAGPLRPFWEEGKEGLVVVLPEQRRVAHAAAVRDVASLRQVDREMDELCSSFVFRVRLSFSLPFFD